MRSLFYRLFPEGLSDFATYMIIVGVAIGDDGGVAWWLVVPAGSVGFL